MLSKKALIITYYWPPAGGPGVQRWLKFVKYLPEFNIEPVVYIPENPSYPLIDKTLLDQVPDGLTILKLPIKEPYGLAGLLSKNKSKTISKGIIPGTQNQTFIERLLLFIRGNFFIPDARKAWVKPSVTYLKEYIKNKKIDTIITTGPPHSLHLIGLQLQEQLGLKWLADFRDPWTTIGYHNQLKLTKAAQRKHKTLEKQVLTTADHIVVTSANTKIEFEVLTTKPITIITNGFDKESVGAVPLDDKFTVSHIGSLLSKRNPKVLWQVFRDLIIENAEFAKDFQLNLVGAVSEDVLRSLAYDDLTNYVNKIGYLTHKEAIKYQKKSQVLLMIEIDSDNTKSIIPGKLFEYMASNRPIVALGPEGSDVEKILKQTNTGNYFNYKDYKAIKSLILKHYYDYKLGELQAHGIGIQKYSRYGLTETLSKII